MITVHFDFPEEEDQESVEALVATVPRIGETVGIRPTPAGGDTRILDKVMDVRHYFTLLHDKSVAGAHEIRILLGRA